MRGEGAVAPPKTSRSPRGPTGKLRAGYRSALGMSQWHTHKGREVFPCLSGDDLLEIGEELVTRAQDLGVLLAWEPYLGDWPSLRTQV